MHKIKEKGASKSSVVFKRPVKHMQPQSQRIWSSNQATEIALKANETNHKNRMMFRLSPKSVGITSKNENKPNQTRNKCIWGYHPNNDRCFCLGIFMLVAAKQVSNKSVSSSNPCSLSTEALLNITTLQLTPWPLCLNIVTWLHLSHCFTSLVANVQTLAQDNICFSFNPSGYAHYGELLAEGWGRLWIKWKTQPHSEIFLYFNLYLLLVTKINDMIAHSES